MRETLYKHALEHLEAAGPEKNTYIFLATVNAYQYLTFLKVCDWSGHIFGASASPRSLTKKKLAMSPSSTVHGGQHDTKYVTSELLTHAAFVADEILGFMPEPARIVSAIDYGECLLIGIVQATDFGDRLLIGFVQTIDFGCCLLIGIVQTRDFGDHLIIAIV